MHDPNDHADLFALDAAAILGDLPDADAAPSAWAALSQAPALAPAPAREELALQFTGSGGEYFRIWIVNLLLTVATLGIYSAWAKTRRLQYFYRNTRLAGASFDFCGDPKAILRGRLVAVVLLAAWHYAFGFSLRAGVITVGLLLVALPFMLRSALRFRLSNTWYRGLPFGFAGGVPQAYGVYLPAVAIFVLPGAVVAALPANPMAGFGFVLYLAWPLIHGAMKRYQHGNLMYGDRQADFPVPLGRLVGPYLKAGLAGIGLVIVSGIAMVVVTGVFKKDGVAAGLAAIGVGVGVAYLFMVLSGPWITVRIGNRAWSGTSFAEVGIACRMHVWSYARLQTVNVLLTLITLGLFRPFAVVRTWRYRVAHVTVEAADGFERATASAAPRRGTGAGDGVADFLDVDLSW